MGVELTLPLAWPLTVCLIAKSKFHRTYILLVTRQDAQNETWAKCAPAPNASNRYFQPGDQIMTMLWENLSFWGSVLNFCNIWKYLSSLRHDQSKTTSQYLFGRPDDRFMWPWSHSFCVSCEYSNKLHTEMPFQWEFWTKWQGNKDKCFQSCICVITRGIRYGAHTLYKLYCELRAQGSLKITYIHCQINCVSTVWSMRNAFVSVENIDKTICLMMPSGKAAKRRQ